MTARTGAISVGLRASTVMRVPKQRAGAIRIGLMSAASSPAWAGRARQARSGNWMLRADEAWFDPATGRPTPRFFQFMHEIAENRLGGINGQSVNTVASTVSSTQAEVVAAVTYTQSVSAYAQGIAATAEATQQVSEANSLAGASEIPDVPIPPKYYKYDSGV